MRERPISVPPLMLLLLFQGLSGLAGGLGLVLDPTGEGLGLSPELLEGSPFGSYLFPGLVLLVVLGVIPCLVLYGLWTRRSWSRLGAVGVGVALVIWIGVQVLIVGYRSDPPLQAVYGAIGLTIAGLGSLPSVKWHLDEET